MGCLKVEISRLAGNGAISVNRIGGDGSLSVSLVCAHGESHGFLRDKNGVYIKDVLGRYIKVLTNAINTNINE